MLPTVRSSRGPRRWPLSGLPTPLCTGLQGPDVCHLRHGSRPILIQWCTEESQHGGGRASTSSPPARQLPPRILPQPRNLPLSLSSASLFLFSTGGATWCGGGDGGDLSGRPVGPWCLWGLPFIYSSSKYFAESHLGCQHTCVVGLVLGSRQRPLCWPICTETSLLSVSFRQRMCREERCLCRERLAHDKGENSGSDVDCTLALQRERVDLFCNSLRPQNKRID